MATTSEVRYDADGSEMVAHLAVPDRVGPWPALLLAHDGIGLDDYQRSRADDLADHGYLTFAMDYHGGRTFFGEPEAMLAHTLPLLDDTGRMSALGRAALDVMLDVPGADANRLGVLGFGAGGSIVLELVRRIAHIRGAAVIHPAVPDARSDDWTSVTAEVLLATGSADPICPPGQLLAFGDVLDQAGVDWRAAVYGGAEHAFWSEPDGGPTVPGVGHHPAHARHLWRDVLDHFESVFVRQ